MELPLALYLVSPDASSDDKALTQMCRELKMHLSEYLDDELESQVCVQVEAHLRECPNCRVTVDTMRKTIFLYHALDNEAMPDGARARLYHALNLQELRLEATHE
jgi:anti-sigma factor RsiW